MIRSPSIEGTNAVSDCQSGRFLDRYLGARVRGNPSRDDVLAALREHVTSPSRWATNATTAP